LKDTHIVDRHICGLTFMEYMVVRWGYWPGAGQHFVVLCWYPAWLPVLEHSRKIRRDIIRTRSESPAL